MSVDLAAAVNGLEALPREQPLDPGWLASGTSSSAGDASGGFNRITVSVPGGKSALLLQVSAVSSSVPSDPEWLFTQTFRGTNAPISRIVTTLGTAFLLAPRSAGTLTLKDELPTAIMEPFGSTSPAFSWSMPNDNGVTLTVSYLMLLWQHSEQKQLPWRAFQAYF